MSHHHPASVARQALGRSSWNACAVLEDRPAGLIGVGEDLGVHVDHHLVALARGAGIDPVVESGLREQCQRIRLLLDHRRRVALRLFSAGPLVQGLAGGGQGLHEQRADFRRESPAENEGAVRVGIDV